MRLVEFIDESAVSDGTPLNRANMMAIQGFVTSSTQISADGKTITETDAQGYKLITTIGDNEIVEQFKGEKTITKTIQINENGFSEVVS